MSESKEYDIGFQSTLNWLTAGSKGRQPMPGPTLSEYAADDWWAGSYSAFACFSEASIVRDQLITQVEDLVVHLVACIGTVLGVYLVVDCPTIAKCLGILILIVSYNLFRKSSLNSKVNKEQQ